MTFEKYFRHAQTLERHQVGKDVILKASNRGNCVICDEPTYWRETVTLLPVCDRQCLFHLRKSVRKLYRASQEKSANQDNRQFCTEWPT